MAGTVGGLRKPAGLLRTDHQRMDAAHPQDHVLFTTSFVTANTDASADSTYVYGSTTLLDNYTDQALRVRTMGFILPFLYHPHE